MNLYSLVAKAYSLLDLFYFQEKGPNPREIIDNLIPDQNVRILDLCCGTLSNTVRIAEKKSKIRVMGLDLSKDMLKVAKKRIKKQELKNVMLKCGDATDTGLKEHAFDYIIIGLVLHESTPHLIDGILKESRRLLKQDGKLIVLEWEKQHNFVRKLKFAPLYWLEMINCRTFHDFYKADKQTYFEERGYHVIKQYHCNYSIVLEMKRKEL